MTRRLAIIALVVVSLLLIVGAVVLAISPYPSSSSGFVDSANNYNAAGGGTPVIIDASTPPGGSCTDHLNTGLFYWTGLDSITTAISSARITVTVSGTNGGADGQTIALYAATNEKPPATITSTTVLATAILPNPLTTPTTVVFQTSTNLITYLNAARLSGGAATLAIRFSTCGTSSNVELGDTAQLSVYGPNAVTLSTFHTADPTPNWPLIAGAAGLSGMAVMLMVIRRRRATVRA